MYDSTEESENYRDNNRKIQTISYLLGKQLHDWFFVMRKVTNTATFSNIFNSFFYCMMDIWIFFFGLIWEGSGQNKGAGILEEENLNDYLLIGLVNDDFHQITKRTDFMLKSLQNTALYNDEEGEYGEGE